MRVGDYHTLVPEEYEEEIGVQEIVQHKEYRPDSSDYDIALVRLQGPEEQCARFSTHVLPACLPIWRERPQKTAPNCYITGWGDTGNFQKPFFLARVITAVWKALFIFSTCYYCTLHAHVVSCVGRTSRNIHFGFVSATLGAKNRQSVSCREQTGK